MQQGRILSRLLPGLYALTGSFIIAICWGWYHFNKHPKWVFFGKELAAVVAVTVIFVLCKALYSHLVAKLKRHSFWQTEFLHEFDRLYFFASLLFFIFFLRTEWVSLLYTALLLPVIFWQLQKSVAKHPASVPWLTANRSIFVLAYFLFVVQAVVQFAAYHYYILDENIRFFNIVLFRSVVMTLFWLFGFAIANFFYSQFRGFARYVLLGAWIGFFTFFLVLWVVNVGILYYSGLYFSPVALEHAEGASDVIANQFTFYLAGVGFITLVSFFVILWQTMRAHQTVGKRYWHFYNAVLCVVAIAAFGSLTSFQNTPEHAMVSSFYNYYFGKQVSVSLDPVLQKKLEKFGLTYRPNDFYVISHDTVFTPTTTKFLPNRLLQNKPNILIVYLESFSARLTDVYSSKYPGVTPHLLDFANDPHSTTFKNYYNASTPTITGTLSQLCSFLPPTGHNEIQNERKLQSHHLLCLPEVLKKYAGYKSATYVTAVEKEFAHKDGIFTSMGVDTIYGTEELKKYIQGEPLSWGYSDHQLFPAVWHFMQTTPQPFLMMLATVDTHPPFNLAKDAVNYGDGSRPVLNMFHTTDDAFGVFWNEFKSSPFYKNTIVVAVADHAIFPGALTTDLFPEEAKTLSYYDQNFFVMYVPDSILPHEVLPYASGIDQTPTVLQMLDVNIPNTFEGHSIFDDRTAYPNVLGMHELGLYINQLNEKGKRQVDYNVPTEISCPKEYEASSTPLLTMCDYLHFFEWKRQMFEEGRFWKH